MNFLISGCDVKIPKVTEFIVGDFYALTNGNVIMFFGINFRKWILRPMKEMKISLDTETYLKKFKLKKDAYDTEIQFDFEQKPIIPVKVFMAQLKSMIENQPNCEFKVDGLFNSNKQANIFNVDLSEINTELGVVIVYVIRYLNGWRCDILPPEDNNSLSAGDLLFSPATF